MKITINGLSKEIDVDPNTPLLWVIRENLKLTGTKFGCGVGLCGACTVHLDGNPVRSCMTAVSAAENKSITTIEGIGTLESGLNYIQEAWIAEQVPQCGYCQSGQIMSAAALLSKKPSPSDAEIDEAMNGNICRCGMYGRIRNGIKVAAQNLKESKNLSNG